MDLVKGKAFDAHLLSLTRLFKKKSFSICLSRHTSEKNGHFLIDGKVEAGFSFCSINKKTVLGQPLDNFRAVLGAVVTL